MASVLSGIATYTGTVIGAGIFALPFVIAGAGLWPGIFLLVLVGGLMLLTNLMLGELMLCTKEHHQLSGLAGYFLGAWGKRLMAVSMFVGIYGALVAYTIGIGQSLASVFGGFWIWWSVFFFVVAASILYGNVRALKQSENYLAVAKLALFLAVVAVLFTSRLDFSGVQAVNWVFLVQSFGVVLFAFLGTAAVPEIELEYHKHRHLLRKSLLIGGYIPVLVYVVFGVGVVGVTGISTTEVATVGLSAALPWANWVFNGFAAVAMITAFLGLGFALKDNYEYDFGVPHFWAWFLTLSVPVLMILLGARSFVQAIGLAGAVGGGLAGVLVMLMHGRNGNRKPEYRVPVPGWARMVLAGIFIAGALSAVVAFF